MKKSIKDALKKLSEQELVHKADLLRRDLFSVRLHAATRPVKDNNTYKKMRKDIARALTFLRQAKLVNKATI